jgi:hypothetical protein
MTKLEKARIVFDQVECALLSFKSLRDPNGEGDDNYKIDKAIEGLEDGLGWVEDYVDYLRSENE